MVGRASKRGPDTANSIIQTLEIGGTRKMACGLVGISTDTLIRWERSDASFALRLKDAESKRDRSLVVDIRSAAKRDWKAAAWLLERVAREDYGTRQEITGKDGGPIKIDQVTRDMTAFSDDQIETLAGIAEQVKSGALPS